MTQLIGKIKLNNNKTEITLIEELRHDQSYITKETTITSDELRSPDFDHAAVAIVPWLVKEFGLPKEWDVTIKNISIDREDGFAADIGLYVKFGDKFTNGTNLPLPTVGYDPEIKVNKMPQQLYDAIVKLIGEASDFAFKNKRAQISLLDEKSDEEIEEEKIRPIRGKRTHG